MPGGSQFLPKSASAFESATLGSIPTNLSLTARNGVKMADNTETCSCLLPPLFRLDGATLRCERCGLPMLDKTKNSPSRAWSSVSGRRIVTQDDFVKAKRDAARGDSAAVAALADFNQKRLRDNPKQAGNELARQYGSNQLPKWAWAVIVVVLLGLFGACSGAFSSESDACSVFTGADLDYCLDSLSGG